MGVTLPFLPPAGRLNVNVDAANGELVMTTIESAEPATAEIEAGTASPETSEAS